MLGLEWIKPLSLTFQVQHETSLKQVLFEIELSKYVSLDLSIKGVPVKLLDTAGIREGSDIVEQMGIERASATARGADLVLMVMDYSEGWTDSDALVFSSLWGNGTSTNGKKLNITGILVANKIDKTSVLAPDFSSRFIIHPREYKSSFTSFESF